MSLTPSALDLLPHGVVTTMLALTLGLRAARPQEKEREREGERETDRQTDTLAMHCQRFITDNCWQCCVPLRLYKLTAETMICGV